jgi:molybdate transport system substrate-binding protein
MKMRLALAGGLVVLASLAQAAEIKVLSGNGAKAAVRELCTQFERATGNKINLHFEVNADIQKKIEAGEYFDVAVLNPPVIETLSKEAKIMAGSRADIGRAGLGVAVRQGAPKPDISSVDAFRRTLLASKSVAFPGKGASGLYFVSLLDRMGIKAEMQGKLKPMEAEDTVEEGGCSRRSRPRGRRRHAYHGRRRRRCGRPHSRGTADENRLRGRSVVVHERT